MGATGTLDIDGLTVELIEVEAAASTNLVVNGDFELGDPAPFGWTTEKDARRVFPGFNSSAALELRERNSRAAGRAGDCGRAVRRARHLDGRAGIRPQGRRWARPPASSSSTISAGRSPVTKRRLLLSWSDSFDWRVDTAYVRVPPGARRAVLQIDKKRRVRRDSLRRRANHGVAQSGRRIVDAVSGHR